MIFHCINTPHSMYPFICKHLGCVHFFSVVNSCTSIYWVLALHSLGNNMFKWSCWNLLFMHFEIVIVLGKSCKNNTEVRCNSFNQLPLMVTHYITTVQLSKLVSKK